MQLDPNVDRALGELWLISDTVTADLREDFAAAREEARRWHPSAMPPDWRPDVEQQRHLRRV